MKYIISFILILCSWFANSQTSMTFTKIPYSAPDLKRPRAGLEYWIYQSLVPVPEATSPIHNEGSRYDRFEWQQFEATKGVYDFSAFDASVRTAIDRGQTFSFGVMNFCEPCTDYARSIDGASLRTYPTWLYNEMKTDADEPFNSGGIWIPNWNNTRFWTRFEALLTALNTHIQASSYNGIPFRNLIKNVDLRGMGNFGEWHFFPFLNDMYTDNRYPTAATCNNLIDLYIRSFPDFHLLVSFDIFAAQGSFSWSEFPAEVPYYALTQRNNKGLIGWRRDSWGDHEVWLSNRLENNNITYNGVALKDSIVPRWKYAPVGGELLECCTDNDGIGGDGITGTGPYWDLERQMAFYHVSTLGNGNYAPYIFYAEQKLAIGENTEFQERMRAAGKRAGYRYVLNSSTMTTTLASNSTFNISLNWGNEGVAPTYDKWIVRYTLRNSTTGAVAWTGNSAVDLRYLLPDSTKIVSENFTATNVPAGNYRLHMAVIDSMGYMSPMPIFIHGRQSDGSYILRSNITVTSSGNLPPTANAGTDRNITLPTNSVTLNGSGNDPDGTLAGGQWTRVSGPTTFTIVSPTSATTQVTNLVAGTYVFRLTVTDNLGATGFDDVTVIVNAAAPSNLPPVANAGANQVIQLPTNSVSVVGSATDADGTVASYIWEQVSGPNTATIDAPFSASTNILGLVAGVYVFRLTAEDDDGATGTDDVQITVTAANVAPSANAGADQTITLPTNSATLSGSGTDSDGTITGYLWTKVSGPTGGAISSPNTAGTAITGLIQGVYVYRLRVTDNQGATATDEITITVNPAPVVVPGNWIFTTTPSLEERDDPDAVVLGVKFRSTQAGAITQLRFWKTPTNTGTHVAGLYTESGTLLWSGTFTNETASGWQYITTDTVFIDPNTTYIAAVLMPTGNYGREEFGLSAARTNNMLTAPNSDAVGGNGVYIYSPSLVFPSLSYNATNYWIDVNYQNIAAPTTPNVGPSVSAGLDQTIRLPQDTVNLSGTATDSDGTIVSIDWAQLSGPVTATISDTTALNPTITGLSVAGVYQFLLTVRDDDGATSTDIIAIAVNGAATNWQRRRTYIFNNRRIYFRQ